MSNANGEEGGRPRTPRPKSGPAWKTGLRAWDTGSTPSGQERSARHPQLAADHLCDRWRRRASAAWRTPKGEKGVAAT
jgi:hypothetical protein